MGYSGWMDDCVPQAKRKATISWVTNYLKHSLVAFDTIAISGVSGLLIGPTVADRLSKNLAIVRKPNESAHATKDVGTDLIECEYPISDYIIVDDFVETGATIERMLKEISETYPKSYCFGIFLYSDGPANDKETFDAEEILGYNVKIFQTHEFCKNHPFKRRISRAR